MCQTRTVTDIELPRPGCGDVADLVLAHHRLFEYLVCLLRDCPGDRAAVCAAVAGLLEIHGRLGAPAQWPGIS
jgi:hypothetical protein